MSGPTIVLLFAALLSVASVSAENRPEYKAYSNGEIMQQIEAFFGKDAEGLAEVVEKAAEDHGQPIAYIAGDEVSAAPGLGIRYGQGLLRTKSGQEVEVHWRGPSVGFDAGANASKVFVLVYRLPQLDSIFQLYPGVEGSLYFAGSAGMNYLRIGNTVIVPIRLGADWRQDAKIGYMDFTREASVVPF